MKTAKTYGLSAMIFFLALAITFVCQETVLAKNTFVWRAVLAPSVNFASKNQMQASIDFLPRMKKAGYNGLFLDCFLMPRLHSLKAETRANVDRVVAAAKQNGIAVIPMSEGQRPNAFMDSALVEAFPCKGTPFLVKNGTAEVKNDPSVTLVNGGFEGGLSGWQLNRGFFSVDSVVKKSGHASLRCDDPTKNYLRASQYVTVKPYRTYELSMWAKTQNVVNYPDPTGTVGCKNIGFTVQAGKSYIYENRESRSGLSRNNNWKQVKAYFYSLDYASVQVQAQVTKRVRFTGKAWLDDIRIREVGLFDAVTRENMEIVVRDSFGNMLVAGRDYEVRGQSLSIPAGSSAKEGDELLVDWYKAANVVTNQSSPAFCYDNVWNGVREQISVADEWFGTPPARIMKYSEWRLAGWDPYCAQQYQVAQVGSGRYMDAVANITSALYKEANGSRLSLVFNDAYDPYHNSRSNYYVVHGGCVGSGYALDEDIIIMNWNVHNRQASLKYFAGKDKTSRPHFGVKTSRQRQIISSGVGSWSTYTDKNGNRKVGWLDHLDSLESRGELPDGSVVGISYHTYKPFPEYYDHIEEMAKACSIAGRWESGPIPFPAATSGIPYEGVGVKRETETVVTGVSLSTSGGVNAKSRGLCFSIPKMGMVHLALYNIQGQMIRQIVGETLASGGHHRTVNLSNVAPGTYFAKLVSEGSVRQSVAKKILVF